MECPNCRAISNGGKFCMECGEPLPLACRSCGLGNPSSAKFCANCGVKLVVEPAGLAETHASPGSSAERRQLTVMFCDLVGSTALSTKLDPEDLGRVIADFRAACADAVTQFGGSVAKFMGDGALVYFGYPEAYEDAATRAILAGLALIESVESLSRSTPDFPQLRVGIATGVVVVGELIGKGASHERVAVGETLNLAARLQSLAAPGSIVISESTWSLAGGAFRYADLGLQTLKGIATPSRAWAVVGENSADRRFAAGTSKGTTPLVGRIDEIGMMRQRWERAVDGDGQVILLSAPAGMGKSRMTQAFRDGFGGVGPICIQFFCSPYHTNSALYPFVRQLEFAAGFDRGNSADQKLDKLEAALAGPADVVAEAIPLLAALLSIPYVQRYPQLETIMSDLVRKQRTMHVIEEQLALLSVRSPMPDRHVLRAPPARAQAPAWLRSDRARRARSRLRRPRTVRGPSPPSDRRRARRFATAPWHALGPRVAPSLCRAARAPADHPAARSASKRRGRRPLRVHVPPP
jgi:class 3 adenylate cyclase